MRRYVITVVVAAGLATLLVPPVSGLAGTLLPHRAKPAYGHLTACHRALDGLSRYLVMTGDMRRVAGTSRMEIRFDLFARRAGHRHYSVVPGPGLGTWYVSQPGKHRFRFRKRIENLPLGEVYRGRIGFRWRDSDGHVIASARRTTRTCAQPDLRPNLVVRGLREVAIPGHPLRAAYTALVRNVGRTAAGAFGVSLSVDGIDQPPREIRGLVAGSQVPARRLTFDAPRCAAGGIVTVSVDPQAQVDESREDDNVLRVSCPGA